MSSPFIAPIAFGLLLAGLNAFQASRAWRLPPSVERTVLIAVFGVLTAFSLGVVAFVLTLGLGSL